MFSKAEDDQWLLPRTQARGRSRNGSIRAVDFGEADADFGGMSSTEYTEGVLSHGIRMDVCLDVSEAGQEGWR